MIAYKNIQVDGLNLFYREAGNPKSPVILLLHGFPTSSHMFRNLIPQLATDHHVIAPDLPGFGFSDAAAACSFQLRLLIIWRKVIDARSPNSLALKRFALYIFDYGAPVGLRLALRHPERISAIISQNGNAYEEGLSDGWNPIQKYWQDPSAANRAALRDFLKPEERPEMAIHARGRRSLGGCA